MHRTENVKKVELAPKNYSSDVGIIEQAMNGPSRSNKRQKPRQTIIWYGVQAIEIL